MEKRIALWDNLKFLLIILVVIGHFAQQLRDNNEILQRIYVLIYSFHMPAFIFVTGLFSKRAVNEKDIKKILPYLTCFFATAVTLFLTTSALGWESKFELFNPGGLPWYLMSMFIMFLITMLLKDYKPQYIFILSLLIGVMCGFVQAEDPDFFTWMRTLIFYPFFYLGYCLDSEKIEKATNKIYLKIIAIVFFVTMYILIFSFPKEARTLSQLNTARHFYSELGRFEPLGWLYRIMCYAIGFAAIFLLISLLPRKNISAFTKYGGRTLGIYMFHYVIIYILLYVFNIQDIFKSVFPNSWAYLIIPVAILTAYFCGNPLFNQISQKLFSRKGKLKG